MLACALAFVFTWLVARGGGWGGQTADDASILLPAGQRDGSRPSASYSHPAELQNLEETQEVTVEVLPERWEVRTLGWEGMKVML